MTSETRRRRLAAELASLQALKRGSSIFDFEIRGDPPDGYTLRFHGRGVGRGSATRVDIELQDEHQIDIRLPYAFPQQPPDLRWQTPLFHPNVSFSGFIQLDDLGLAWDEDLGLDLLCERLWDVARMAYVDLAHATNLRAKNWLLAHHRFRRPVDPRPLRDKATRADPTVWREPDPRSPGRSRTGGEVLFIGEETPTPELPVRPPRPRAREEDDDILYIGDD